ncbi:type II toxin-antitoxin system RelE/ParE family toxin [Mucilaginibacter terrae]|uniref:Plasmid stabilization system protein ParE n=1 Tax=Mucilaginibacter terrae TaxID=1955052 RepID=A0ABU3GSI0_9SPHI|nr:type II toxin-antitoxin system RelE/ParE family toxin [Mucilaginibacter terrae]MDT3402739.1 plasmid stabilization system protein ParE [Mucilaginibacter terrae]
MSLSVAWTDEAQGTFQQIISLIEDKWGSTPAQKFVQSVQKTILLIQTQPYL